MMIVRFSFIIYSLILNIELSAQQHLIKTIEVTRVNLFNIITQYRAIFLDDVTKNESTFEANKIFHSWLHDRVNF